ncbi:transglutaminaseTgpA domain-containing protein [Deinococcus arenicola]|uniref:TransglutaminaseTgpA domain-containing protein n=1 Tax=Deinococcus arenicola TaxID=2994950 RepID=A0ABU4DN36_9DEIO|nr:transglutaminaseTgpA domain-containing protein [Deinococcus sp. ZS9-10]MDV6373848.1 transglutaminaseTgpA domain-containing protein [Deinococcus sp. ZS9-10]
MTTNQTQNAKRLSSASLPTVQSSTPALRPTRFGLAYLLLVVLTLVGCINYGLSLGYGLTFLLGGVWVMASTGVARAARQVRLNLTAPAGATAGQEALFTLSVTSTVAGAVTVVLKSSGGDTRTLDTRTVTLRVGAGEVRTLGVPFPARGRGPLTVTPLRPAALDFLGLWGASLEAPAPVTVNVAPAPEVGAPPALSRTVPGLGDGQTRTRGDEEFAGLRPYIPGDSPRQISWRHVARTGNLLTRETDAPQGRVRLLDWADAGVVSGGETEARLSRLAAWVTELSGAGQPFALKLPSGALEAGSGEGQRLLALKLLARVAPFPAVTLPAKVKMLGATDADALRVTLLALAFTLAPAVLRQPLWDSALVAGLLTYGAIRTRLKLPALPTWALGLTAGLAAVALNASYGTLLGRDAGTALLALLVALKTAESQDRRDGHLLVLLGLFFASTHFFHSQGPLTALHAVLSVALLLAAASRWTAPARQDREEEVALPSTLVRSGTLLALAAPLALTLFVLFPRPESPLWQLPIQGGTTTGLSSEIRAGEYSNLAQNRAVAFRADFTGALPAPDQRYWRGPVYEAYDGQSWKQLRLGGGSPSIESLASAPAWKYTLTLEASGNPWLLTLDTPTQLPQGTLLTTAFQAVSLRPVTARRRVTVESRPARLGVSENPERLQYDLYLPPGQSPRAAALGREWQKLPPQGRIDTALDYLRGGGFTYTLSPPLLPEQDRVDSFLFGTKQGFCEHYAQSFVFLMRAAGLPARIVGGYLGGEQNPDGGYLIVRQQDAHAWAEVWIQGQGWQRVDPTAVVAPARVSAGLSTALTQPLASAAAAPTSLSRLGLRLDALQSRWNDLIVGYDGGQQQALLLRVGLGSVGSVPYLAVLPLLLGLALLPALWWLRRQALPRDPAARALHRLTVRLGLPRAPGETPSAYAARAAAARPHQAPALDEVVNAYQVARYAPGDSAEALKALTAALRKVKR